MKHLIWIFFFGIPLFAVAMVGLIVALIGWNWGSAILSDLWDGIWDESEKFTLSK